MKDTVASQLKNIEEQFNINILYACESGSRAWGFPSVDSDFDVRFIYAQPLSWYLSIENKPDTIVLPINDELDINGWDIRKALILMRKYNAPLSEWLISPIVYYKEDEFTQKLQNLSKKSFSSLRAFYHYNAQAKKFYVERNNESFSIKSFLYFLRATLCMLWIEKYKTQPPIDIFELATPLNLKGNFNILLKDMIDYKYLRHEKDKISEKFNELVESGFIIFNESQREFTNIEKNTVLDINAYDELLFQTVVGNI